MKLYKLVYMKKNHLSLSYLNVDTQRSSSEFLNSQYLINLFSITILTAVLQFSGLVDDALTNSLMFDRLTLNDRLID